MTTDRKPDSAKVMRGLKDFQRVTVEHVHRRLWTDDDAVKRFLVADEVGLGKTLVAKGVIAKTVEHLWDTRKRIDIVYICSNQQIAQQNLSRLNVVDGQKLDHADRLTMLPTVIKRLNDRRINIVSFTPGTSFHVKGGGGKAPERVVLYWLLAAAYGRRYVAPARWAKFFRGWSGQRSFDAQLGWFDRGSLDPEIVGAFRIAFEEAPAPEGGSLKDALEAGVREFNYLRGEPRPEVSARRYSLIGALRSVVARASVAALEPDLVIMDEFQRFKDLMAPGSDAADLAHAIFEHPDARVLLLSATPFKMYTLPDEPEGDDHYTDFVSTVRFLTDDVRAAAVEKDLHAMRIAMVDGGATAEAREAKNRVEATLRSVMCRTERLAVTPDRDGMLREVPSIDGHLGLADLRGLKAIAGVARALRSTDIFEYWRSAPYVLNLMEHEGYKVKTDLLAAQEQPAVGRALAAARDGLLPWEDIERYRTLDPGNTKMRGLMADVLDSGAWRLAWLPPSLPYLELGGAYADPRLRTFTKRLVFSAWQVVPKAIAVVLSYEAERRGVEATRGARRDTYSGDRQTALLQFRLDGERAASMPVLALLYPSTTLAELGDPLAVARAVAVDLPASREAVMGEVRSRIGQALESLPDGDPAVGSGPDQRWYWAAPVLLDRLRGGEAQQRLERELGRRIAEADELARGLAAHLDVMAGVRADALGPRPDDLVDVLARLAVGGPAVCAARALSRVCGGRDALRDGDVRGYAAAVADALRSLFNRPELMSVLRGEDDADDSYWRLVLDHAIDGGLQAVLDEYAHVLLESEGLQDSDGPARAERIARRMGEALTIRTPSNRVDELQPHEGGFAVTRHAVRTHFAARFGRATADDKTVVRETQVQTAFNSPFWPFVLASTSVGQEGLDFHTYSHAVVHWNLPANPVDLEQREGRVHRYKGHAVRKNVAQRHGDAALHASVDDPWFEMFLAAAESRDINASDIVPCWVYPGETSIERYVPAMPLSSEMRRYHRLQRTVGAYRLVVGQPRQEDLLKYVGSGTDVEWMRMDLSPR